VVAIARPTRWRGLWRTWSGVRASLAALPEATSLGRLVGRDRTFALIRARLDEVARIAHGRGVKINDVLLAAVTGGLRAVLLGRGEAVDLELPVFVPRTLRQEQPRTGGAGNLVSEMVVTVPLGPADPDDRLQSIGAATAAAKSRPRVSLGSVLGGRFTQWMMVRLVERHPVSVTTADIMGPQGTVTIAGARVLEVFPVLPLIHQVALGVGALSYADQFAITVVADPAAFPDLEVLVAGAEEDLRRLALAEPVLRSRD
jgi:hypothetical protein